MAIVVLVAAGMLLWLAWVSIQSIRQSRLLLRCQPRSGEIPQPPGPAALYGPVQVLRPIREQGFEDYLWHRETHQVYSRSGKHARWHTVSETQQVATFTVEVNGEVFQVEAAPTEVQGGESRTVYEQSRFGQLWSPSGHRRVIHRWLSVPTHLTVLGRLHRTGGEVRVAQDDGVGLLFSPHDPSDAANIEFLKGLGGLLAALAAFGAGIWYYLQRPTF